MEGSDRVPLGGSERTGMVIPLGRAISELLAPISTTARNPSKATKKMKKRFEIAKMQVLLRRQRRDMSHKGTTWSTEESRASGKHDSKHAPIVDALLTVDDFLFRLGSSVQRFSDLFSKLSADHTGEASKILAAAQTKPDLLTCG